MAAFLGSLAPQWFGGEEKATPRGGTQSRKAGARRQEPGSPGAPFGGAHSRPPGRPAGRDGGAYSPGGRKAETHNPWEVIPEQRTLWYSLFGVSFRFTERFRINISDSIVVLHGVPRSGKIVSS